MTEPELKAHVRNLRAKDRNAAYKSLLTLEAESRDSEAVAPYLNEFAALLDDRSALARIRGFRLLAANAPWVEPKRMKSILPRLLGRLTDPKPIVIRQCLAALPELAAGRPELRPALLAALEAADYAGYPGSMRPLLEQDRAGVLEVIKNT